MLKFIRKIAVGLTAAIAVVSYGILIQPSNIPQDITHFKLTEKACLIEALWHEARGEKLQGLLAVASVIENRKNSSKYPNDYCSVIWQDKQFSFTARLPGSERTGIQRVRSSRDPLTRMPFEGLTIRAGSVIFPRQYPSTKPPEKTPHFTDSKILPVISSIADRMVNRKFEPVLEPAVLWYTTKAVSNAWTKRLRVYTEVNNHRFYYTIAGSS